jgi:glyoxalase family protein
VAWTAPDEEHEAWHDAVHAAGRRPSPIIDRQYFHSIYFREPSAVLFELATPSPGFAVDEAPEALGESLRLPPQYEGIRARLERTLDPIANPRQTVSR